VAHNEKSLCARQALNNLADAASHNKYNVAQIQIQKELKVLSGSSCLTSDEQKETAYSHYDQVIASITDNLFTELKEKISNEFRNRNSYGRTISIDIHCDFQGLSADENKQASIENPALALP